MPNAHRKINIDVMVLSIFTLFIVGALLYMIAIPLFESSDEAEHFIYIDYLLDKGDLPQIQSRLEASKQSDPVLRWNNQSHHPPLYYALGAFLVQWSDRSRLADYLIPNDIIFVRGIFANNVNKWLHPPAYPADQTGLAVYVLRLANIGISFLTLILIYRTARLLVERRATALLATLLVVTIPTFSVVSASVSNDALLIFLYTAGLFICIRMLKRQRIGRLDFVMLPLVMACIALTKITGLSLIGIIVISLGIGLYRRYFGWRRAAALLVVTGLVTIILAGWWYLRNLNLYGDLLAQGAVAEIWGRDYDSSLINNSPLGELERIAKSFWMMVGYLHNAVFTPYSYYLYAYALSIIGFTGVLVYARKNTKSRMVKDVALVFLATCLLVLVMLLYGTRGVDISYGRLLFPALSAFAILVAGGLYRLMKRYSLILMVPMLFWWLYIPTIYLWDVYPELEPVGTVAGVPLNYETGGLTLATYEVRSAVLKENDDLEIYFYVSGPHEDNLALQLTAIDARTGERMGYSEMYAGMSPSDRLIEGQVYRAPFRIQSAAVDVPQAPRQVQLKVQWFDVGSGEAVAFEQPANPSLIDLPVTRIDSDYKAETLRYAADVNYGGQIHLQAYDIDYDAAKKLIYFKANWDGLSIMQEDWVLTLQLYDGDGQFLMQSDGPIPAYPTSRWLSNWPFTSEHELRVADEIELGDDYEIRLGWYRLSDLERLRIVNEVRQQDNLFMIPLEAKAD